MPLYSWSLPYLKHHVTTGMTYDQMHLDSFRYLITFIPLLNILNQMWLHLQNRARRPFSPSDFSTSSSSWIGWMEGFPKIDPGKEGFTLILSRTLHVSPSVKSGRGGGGRKDDVLLLLILASLERCGNVDVAWIQGREMLSQRGWLLALPVNGKTKAQQIDSADLTRSTADALSFPPFPLATCIWIKCVCDKILINVN